MELQTQKHNFKELNRHKSIEADKQQPVKTRKLILKKQIEKNNQILASI